MEVTKRGLPKGLQKRLREAAKVLEGVQRARILSHYDGDGTAAAALLTMTLLREGMEVHTTLSHHLNAEKVQALAAEEADVLLVSDMGSAQVDLLEKLKIPVIVLDHHQPLRDSDKVVQINPHFFGLSGTKDACGATTAFLLSTSLSDDNLDLAGIALVGCIADRQHLGGFKGINGMLFGKALEKGVLRSERGLALADLSLEEALVYSVGPYFKGMSGRKDEVTRFLSELGLDAERRFRDLESDERENLLSTLSLWLLKQGARPETVQQLVEERYWYQAYEMYVDDLEAYVNACSRQGEESLGLALSLGDFSGKEKAEELRKKHWKAVLKGLMTIENDGTFSKDHLQFFYADGATLAGSVAGVAMRYLLDQEKPTLALAVVDGKTKVSARATDYLIERGVNLAEALRLGAEAVRGSGGGHNIASGATVPKGKEDKFLEVVDSVVGKQLGKEAAA
ncbi:MAG: DHH family phosphoesterase [Thermoplasmata archaeon]